jgi:hypothetical protein
LQPHTRREGFSTEYAKNADFQKYLAHYNQGGGVKPRHPPHRTRTEPIVTIRLTREEINLLEYTFKKSLEFTGFENEQPDQECIKAVNDKLSAARMRAAAPI